VLDNHYYGLYRGICKDNQDPTNHDRIKVAIPDLYGNDFITDWIPGCMPVVSNADHPDHKKHLASEVAALLKAHTDHTFSGNTGSGGSPSHTHSFSFTVAHDNNHSGKTPDTSNYLDHQHVDSSTNTNLPSGNKKDLYDTQDASPQHTYHRTIPNLNQVVWIMFEKGDPNFPVWMGVYS
jgi:hypothetical protein